MRAEFYWENGKVVPLFLQLNSLWHGSYSCLYSFMITIGHLHEVHNEHNHSSKSSVTKISCRNNTFPTIVIFDGNLVNKNVSLKMNVSPVKI